MTNTVSVEIDLAREIYERLLSKGWRKIEKIGIRKRVRSVRSDENNLKFNNENIN